MPGGKTHFKAWKSLSPIPATLGGVAYLYFRGGYFVAELAGKSIPLDSGLLVGSGIILGYLFGAVVDPDSDQMGVTGAEGRLVKIPVLGWLLYGYWSIYGAAFRRKHRSFWTHSYFLSTGIRWLYQFWPVFFWFDNWTKVVIFSAYIGLAISDAVHIFLDRR